MVDPKLRAERRAECRTEIRDHLRKVLPEIEAWAGTPGRGPSGGAVEAGFLGWRRPLDSERSELRNLDRKIAGVLLRIWDPIGVSHEKQAKDEYDCCVPPVQRILLTDAPEVDLADQLREYLRAQEVDHMGIQDSESSARRREVAIQELLSLRE